MPSLDSIHKGVLDPNAGYSLSHVVDDPQHIRVLASHGGKVVGSLHLDRLLPGATHISAFQTQVDPAHQRQGVASAMYAHAEKVTGLKMKPSSAQSQAGRQLWEGNESHPQFGDPMIQKLGKSERDKNLRQVASVAAFQDGKFLMGLRGDVKLWCLPGGHLEPDESPAKGAVRELLEETGLRATSLERLGSAVVGKKGNVQLHCYRADVTGTPDASLDPDAEMVEFRWVDPDDIPEEILSNLYNKEDVTLQLLGAQAKTLELSKASLSEIMARTKAASDHMRTLADQGESLIAFPHPQGGHVMVTRDPSKVNGWRATRVLANGDPTGHVEAPSHHEAIKRAHDYGADIFAVKPFQKNAEEWLAKAQRPEDFKTILNATTPEGKRFVDHKPQMQAHPLSMSPAVEHYENNIKGSSQLFKPKAGSREEGVSRKVIFDNRQSPAHNGLAQPDKYMVKPYHEGIPKRIGSWQKYPIQGWAEMANQALYHAGGIGELHQKVHVSEHDMKSKKKGQSPAEPGLVVHMEPGMKPIFQVKGGIHQDAANKTSHDGLKIGLMDFLTNNLDRHHGNLLVENQEVSKYPPDANIPDWMRNETVTKVNRVMAIDHSRSFQYVNNHHHKWDSQAKLKKTRNLEDSMKPYLFGGNTWKPSVSELYPNASRSSSVGYQGQLDFLNDHAKPLFDWWEQASPKIKASFEDQLQHIKDPEARAHISRNFMERAKFLDERSRMGIENYGTDWYNDTVPQYHPDQKTDEEERGDLLSRVQARDQATGFDRAKFEADEAERKRQGFI